jgi:CubicO group peptidase (beta-lactamase class C family)
VIGVKVFALSVTRALILMSAIAHAWGAPNARIPSASAIDARVLKLLGDTGAKGLALAVIADGKVRHVKAYGVRNASGDHLRADTIMYGASLTKLITAYATLQLVDAGRVSLDASIADVLAQPLPSDGPYEALAKDLRWRNLTPRIILTHATGFANFAFLEPDHQVHFHFDPGARYAYSGEGINLLQFVLEHGRKERGLGVDFGQMVQTSVFARLGMTRTSLRWRDDFAANLADGWNDAGEAVQHDARSNVRAAGSMDTTIDDLAKFAAALVAGRGLSAAARAELVKPQLHITTRTQFPTLQPELPVEQQRKDLYAGIGVVVFDGPEGRGFYKGGHNETTANTLICIEANKRCLVILSNDVRSEADFSNLVEFVLGDTGAPYDWEYGDNAGKS